MMTVDSSVSIGVAGIAAGVVASLWQRKVVLEENCEFLAFARRDLAKAMDTADQVLSDDRTPEVIRTTVKNLLVSYYSPEVGQDLANAFINRLNENDQSRTADNPESNPISVAMREMADLDPTLERNAHRVMMTLVLGISVVHFGDYLEASKMQSEGAKDPNRLWSKVGGVFGFKGGDDHHGMGGGIIHA